MSYEGRVTLQAGRAAHIEAMSKESKKDHFKGLDVAVLQMHLDQLDYHWEKFEDQHEKLLEGKDATILEHSYVKTKVYDECLRCYTAAKAQIITLIRRKDEGADFLFTSFRRQTPTSSHLPGPRQLPKIPLPVFSGKYSGWTGYKDLFTSMVVKNPDLSLVETMIYLRSSLSEEPFQLISNLPVTDDSFKIAWEMLIARYENKRLLITTQLERLLNSSPVQQRTAKELNKLLTNITEAGNALKALECPVDQWDQILTFVTTQRLDPKTREAWEEKIGASTIFPQFEDLKNFVTGRARALESIEMHHGTNPYSQKSPANNLKPTTPSQQHQQGEVPSSKTLVANTTGTGHPEKTTSWAEMSRMPCAMCTDDHFVVSCPQFRQLNPVDRREVVTKKRLCYNCMGKHPVTDCKSVKRCTTCDRKHHSMIHIDGVDPPAPLTPAERKAAGIAKQKAQQAASEMHSVASPTEPRLVSASGSQQQNST